MKKYCLTADEVDLLRRVLNHPDTQEAVKDATKVEAMQAVRVVIRGHFPEYKDLPDRDVSPDFTVARAVVALLGDQFGDHND